MKLEIVGEFWLFLKGVLRGNHDANRCSFPRGFWKPNPTKLFKTFVGIESGMEINMFLLKRCPMPSIPVHMSRGLHFLLAE